jgi:hypothetical protein
MTSYSLEEVCVVEWFSTCSDILVVYNHCKHDKLLIRGGICGRVA